MSLRRLYSLSAIKKAGSVFFGLLATVALNRSLGPEIRGEYAYVESILLTLAIVIQFGTANIFPYFFRRQRKSTEATFMAFFVLQAGVVLLLGGALSLAFGSLDLLVWVAVLVTSVIATQLLQYSIVVDFRAGAIANMGGVFLNAGLLWTVLALDMGSVRIAFLCLVAKDLSIAFFVFWRTRNRYSLRDANFIDFLDLLKTGFIPMLINLLVILNYRLDIMMLDWLGSATAEVGIYAVGVATVQYIWLLPDIFKDVVQNFTAQGDQESLVAMACRMASTAVVAGLVGMSLFGRPVLRILYGEAFVGSYSIMVILSVGVWAMVYTKLLGVLWLAKGEALFYLKIMFIAVIVNATLNIPAILHFGIYGASLVSTLTYTIAGIAFALKFSKVHQLPVRDVLFMNRGDLEVVRAAIRR